MFYLKKNKKRMLALCLSAALSVGSLTVYAATEQWNDASLTPAFTTKTAVSEHTDWADWKANWDKIKTNYEQVALIPGSDFSKLNFGWYSKEKANEAVVRIADNKDMKNAKEFKGTCTEGTVINGVQYYSNKVTADGFEPNTTYYYQVKLNGKWQQAHEYKTGDPHNFSFMYVGDPQIGASKGQVPNESAVEQSEDVAARNDAYNWNKTLNSALAQHPEINFLVSPGDQINEPAGNNAEKHLLQEYEYSGYLSATAFRNLPQAVAIGNHDCLTTSYQNHFNVPNPFTAETNSTVAGHGYYYTYGSALFIVINANNYNAADHKALVEKAVKENPNAKWRIVVMHQDIYGSGLDHSDSDGIILRNQLTPIFDANDIDVVLQGHDHTYARTYQLTSDGKQYDDFAEYKVGQHGQDHKVLDNKLKSDSAFKEYYTSQNRCYTIADMKQGTLVNPLFYCGGNRLTVKNRCHSLPSPFAVLQSFFLLHACRASPCFWRIPSFRAGFPPANTAQGAFSASPIYKSESPNTRRPKSPKAAAIRAGWSSLCRGCPCGSPLQWCVPRRTKCRSPKSAVR